MTLFTHKVVQNIKSQTVLFRTLQNTTLIIRHRFVLVQTGARWGGFGLADVETGDTPAAATLILIIHKQQVDMNMI